MAHPFHEHRQTKKEHSRVGHITKGYAKGGAVKHSDEAEDRKLIRSMVKKADLKAEGGKVKHRMDKPHRAKGGRVGKGKNNSRTIVNVIAGGHPAGGAVPPGPPMGPPPMGVAPGAPPTPPPMAARPMMPPGAGMSPPGAGGPPMPMRARGGKVHKPHGSPVFNESLRDGTQVQHNDSGKSDLGRDNYPRGKAVTFKSGGRVRHFYARGGAVESPQGVAPATKLPGGSGGGEARLAKEHRAVRNYAKPAK